MASGKNKKKQRKVTKTECRKTRTSNSDTTTGASNEDVDRIKNSSFSSLIGRFLLKIGVLVVAIYVIKNYNLFQKERQYEYIESKEDGGRRSFQAGATEVFVQPNFLPIEVAKRWRQTMVDEWNAMGFSNNTDDNNWAENLMDDGHWTFATNNNWAENLMDDGHWTFATNNNGKKGEHNAKTRGLQDIGKRNTTARNMMEKGAFSYAKWELDVEHPLIKEVEYFMTRQETVDKFKTAVGLETDFRPELSDLFVTHFSTGDFLSKHDDFWAGTWAFAISLLDHPLDHLGEQQTWNADQFGGVLRFECPYNRSYHPASSRGKVQWCKELSPSFNSAVFWRVRPKGPAHTVTPVKWPAASLGFRRFGITGWFIEDGDMNEKEKVERDKMRARPN